MKPPHTIDTRREYLALALLLAGLSMLSPFSIDTFFPSFRAMQADLGVSAAQIQQTITAYLVTYALTVIVHGPLSDALGRRPVLLAGTLLYTLGSVACMLAPNFTALLAFRALQGATAGAGIVVGRAIIRDLYDGPRAQKLMNLVALIFGIAPAVAPVIGGWIHIALGWRPVFGFLAMFGLILMLASWWRLPETHAPARRLPFQPRPIARAALTVLADRQFLGLALAAAWVFGAVFCYIAAAPAIVFDHWQLAELQFVWLFLPIIAGFMLGAVISGQIAGRMPLPRQIALGLWSAAAICAVRAFAHGMTDTISIWLQQLMLFTSVLAAQVAIPALTLRMLDLFPALRGSAASMQAFVSLLIMALTAGAVVPLLQTDLFALSAGSLVASVLAVLCWRLSVSTT